MKAVNSESDLLVASLGLVGGKNMFDKTIENLFQIKYPIIQGGMAWISDSSLASAVSEAGGLGVIAAGGAP